MSLIAIDKETDVVYLVTWDELINANGSIKAGYACKTRKTFEEQIEVLRMDDTVINIQGFEMRAVKVKI